MRKFSSYGPINTNLEYYAPRAELIERACLQVFGEEPHDGGHYITVWAPRQTGKSWLMLEVIQRAKALGEYDVATLTMQGIKDVQDDKRVLKHFVLQLSNWFRRDFPDISIWDDLPKLFTSEHFSKPLILIIDEFDAVDDVSINLFANQFRKMHTMRTSEIGTPTAQKIILLHGLALIGVRSVLGIENVSGSPFNVQRSVHVPNLTLEEVRVLFQWYQDESGQKIEDEVIEQIYAEFLGQPGLTCWMGELLTEEYNRHDPVITMDDFKFAYTHALNTLPNNNILNIISKARQDEYLPIVLEMFRTGTKLPFRYDDKTTNYLYMNGVVDHETVLDEKGDYEQYLKFPSPFVQKRLFNAFSHVLFKGLDRLYEPLLDISNIITDTTLDLVGVMHLYEQYIYDNRKWLFREAPRRKTDERIYEAVYHFNLYMYLNQFMRSYHSSVIPEFPTGNGKVDLFVNHGGSRYALEVKSFANRREYKNALAQAAKYADRLQMAQIWLVFFIDTIDDKNRKELESTHLDQKYNVTVYPVFVKTNQ